MALPPRLTSALSVSAAAHAGAAALFLFVIAGVKGGEATRAERRLDREPPSLVWVVRAGSEGGRAPAGHGERPPRALLRAGTDRMTVPAAAEPVVVAAPLAQEPPRVEPIAMIAAPSASALQDVPGTFVALSVAGETGVGRSADSGGEGAESNGLGQGHGRQEGISTGEGPGSGVVAPRLIAQVRPRYTADAMRARIQGIAALEAVVLPDGTVGDVRIVRTLDRTFGLDQEAVVAVKQWRFVPGTRSGRPIPVIVSVELTFTLR